MSSISDTTPHDVALRHIFTSAPDGSGFQTVTCAAELREFAREVQDLVETYPTREDDRPICRQLLPLPETKGAYALTVFAPLEDTPDGRRGDFLAETLVVPGKWLAAGGWDAPAAFEALTWWGPRFRELPQNLEQEPLLPVRPTPLSRLSRFVELVTQDQLDILLLALVQQSHGLSPLRILEASGASPGDLEEIVLLLPLVVPPACRIYRDGDRRRCLSLRTRSPERGMSPFADVTGFPASAADNLKGGVVVDLSGRLPPPGLPGPFGRKYVQWLHGILQEGKWGELELLYQQAEKWPGPAFFSNVENLIQAALRPLPQPSAEADEPAPEPGEDDARAPEGATTEVQAAATKPHRGNRKDRGPVPVSGQPAPPSHAAENEDELLSPVQVRRAAWEVRSEAGGAIWNVLETYREQFVTLTAEVRRDFEGKLRAESARVRQQLAELNKALDGEVKTLERNLKAGKSARQPGSAVLDQLARVREDLRSMRAEMAQVKGQLQALEKGGVAAAGAAPTPVGGPPVQPERKRWLRFVLPTRGAFRAFLRRRRRAAVVAVSAIALAVAGTVAPKFWPAPEVAQTADGWDKTRLVQRARAGEVALRLLAATAVQEDFAPRVHGLTLNLALLRGIPIEETVDCALTQVVLRTSNPDLPVNGTCGPKTAAALDRAPKDDCCRQLQGTEKLRNCFLSSHLRLGRPDADRAESCLGASPWRKERPWSTDEATRALKLFRDAAEAIDEASKPQLAEAVRALDPKHNPRLGNDWARQTLNREEAENVLELLWAALSGKESSLERLDAQQIDQLGRYVAGLASHGGTAGAP